MKIWANRENSMLQRPRGEHVSLGGTEIVQADLRLKEAEDGEA